MNQEDIADLQPDVLDFWFVIMKRSALDCDNMDIRIPPQAAGYQSLADERRLGGDDQLDNQGFFLLGPEIHPLLSKR